MEYQLPESLDAELTLISNMINDPESVDIVFEIISSEEEFFHTNNKLIFKAIRNLQGSGKSINRISLVDDMKTSGDLEKVGGITTIAEISTSFVTGAKTRDLAGIVHEKYLFRRLARAADDIKEMALKAQGQAIDVIGEAEDKILDLALNTGDDKLDMIGHILQETSQDILERSKLEGALSGLSTGFSDLDNMLSGFQKSDLILLAARPSMGKTAIAVNFAVSAAQAGKTVAIFSLEMSKSQLALRIFSQISNIDLSDLIKGNMNGDYWKRIGDALSSFASKPMFIDDRSGATVNDIRSKLRRLKLERGLDLVVIDYLQLMEVTGFSENRTLEISKITRGLKSVAKELDVPIILLSQLSRAPEQRSDHRPLLSDLRESGAIEQDADVVMFLYRDEYYNKDTEDKGIGEVIVAKHRNGPTGTVKLLYKGSNTKFLSMSNVPEPISEVEF